MPSAFMATRASRTMWTSSSSPTRRTSRRSCRPLPTSASERWSLQVSDFLKPTTVVLGRPPAQVDIMTFIKGVDVDEAWARREAGHSTASKSPSSRAEISSTTSARSVVLRTSRTSRASPAPPELGHTDEPDEWWCACCATVTWCRLLQGIGPQAPPRLATPRAARSSHRRGWRGSPGTAHAAMTSTASAPTVDASTTGSFGAVSNSIDCKTSPNSSATAQADGAGPRGESQAASEDEPHQAGRRGPESHAGRRARAGAAGTQ